MAAPKILPAPALAWPIPYEAVLLIAECESLSLKAYKCPAGTWTIGWGETDNVKPGDVCTKEQADQWLFDDLTDRVKNLRELTTEWANDNQIGAFASLAYNIGLEGFKKSTVLRKHNEGDFLAASRAFGLWNKARNPNTGKLEEFAGLTARRARESALYLEPDTDQDAWRPMPQVVKSESSLASSPIVFGSTATAGTGTIVAAGAAFADQLGPVIGKAKEFAETLGTTPMKMLAAVLIVAGLVTLYQRFKQRDQGWA
jgi:lysozyme